MIVEYVVSLGIIIRRISIQLYFAITTLMQITFDTPQLSNFKVEMGTSEKISVFK